MEKKDKARVAIACATAVPGACAVWAGVTLIRKEEVDLLIF